MTAFRIRCLFLMPLTLSVATIGQGADAQRARQPLLADRGVPIIRVGTLSFRDLNRNGHLDRYEDWRLKAAERAADLAARMTLAEKAGQMMHGSLASDPPFSPVAKRYDADAARRMIVDRHVTTAITRLSVPPADLARANNALQDIAAEGRLGIPLLISTDPRNHFQTVAGASVAASGFSQWPEMTGLAAIGDPSVVRVFADIARQEYRATGIHMALSPQIDLATEPRWSRINGTLGEDADLSAVLASAYVAGFQHGRQGVARDGVAAIAKHWVGYGAAKDGFDSHNRYGRFATVTADALPLHIRPFEAAFRANVAGVMPTYSILQKLDVDGKTIEQVGAGFSRYLLTDLLRGRHGFGGIILSDWAITNDCGETCRNGFPKGERPGFLGFSTAWGVEDIDQQARFAKGVNAGLDQFGGVEDSAVLVAAIRAGQVSEARINESVRRILTQTFALGLFENPYVDPDAAAQIVGNGRFKAAAERAQAQSLVVLKNAQGLLPLSSAVMKRVYLRNVDPGAVTAAGFTVVTLPEDADVAIIRTDAPYERLHPNYTFGAMQNEGDLSFRDGNADWEAIKAVSAKVPTIVSVYLDRPAILTNVAEKATALTGNFGMSDTALVAALTGRVKPMGKLPFELPSSMAAVAAQRSDMPHDSADPLYPIGFSLHY